MSETIRVVLVDDDPLVRAGLGMILGGAPDIEVVGEAGDGVEAVATVGTTQPDVVLMDLRMPRRDGLEATRLVVAGQAGSARLTPTRVIVLTTFDTDDMVVSALRVGASGFLLKDTPPQRIVDAIRSVAAGEPTLSPTVTAQLIASVTAGDTDRSTSARSLLDTLTEREREVAVAIGRGRSNAEIAAELYLGVPTVKTHVSRLLTKLDADNRVQIALIVHDAGLT
ncbi:response regulator transcription factor [Phycicoccus sp. Root101]|uniref:response regulator n=1 Tax=Phycicoccus sp. Root101 TaxID=1736421 RepID=UPI000702944D|nr:response regulator transcription factor [Phycicoccus sp. Root101]KQU66515.1 LuxR family transcriptional regulator [Phycicoccus sp. Root101]